MVSVGLGNVPVSPQASWVLQRKDCPVGRGGSAPTNWAGATLGRQRLPDWLEPAVNEERLRE